MCDIAKNTQDTNPPGPNDEHMATSTHRARALEYDYDWNYSPRVTTLFATFVGVAVLGWLVTVILTAVHLFAIPAIPSDAEIQGSLAVITSSWGYVFGIPLATLGGFYYLTTIGLALWWFDTRHPLIVKILTPITASGVLASGYFVWLQLVPIGEICPFCMLSAGATVVLFGLELGILHASDTPKLSAMFGDLSAVLLGTRLSLILPPVLIGLVTLAGLYVTTLLPLPDPVPFA